MAGETVLIVDDAPVNLKLTDILLRKEGYQVHTAADAEEALNLLRSFRPDLMLVDIQMPGMDGLELTRRLKCNPLTRDIVVVALTACAMKDDEQKAIEAGCNGYITKPIDTHTLGSSVRQHLESRHEDAPREGPPVEAPQPQDLPALALSGPHEAVPEALPDFIVEVLAGRLLALLGFAPVEGARLRVALERAGARPRSFDPIDPAQAGAVLDCGAILFHVRPETVDSLWLSPALPPQARIPLILVGQREHILALDRSVQARALEFLIDVWQPEEALMRIGFALARSASPQASRHPRPPGLQSLCRPNEYPHRG